MNIREELEIINKQKYVLNTPRAVINAINRILVNPRLSKKHKKVMLEIKGILIGKYPTKQSMINSVKGLEKKYNSLNEELFNKTEKKLIAVLLALITLASSVSVATIVDRKTGRISAPIERVVNGTKDFSSKQLVVEIDEVEWSKIEKALDEFEKVLDAGDGPDKAFDASEKDLKANGVVVYDKKDDRYLGYHITNDKNVYLNRLSATKYSDSLKKEDPDLKSNSKAVRDSIGGIIRHEKTHLNQDKKLNSFEKRIADVRNNFDSGTQQGYSKQYSEIGAHYNQIKYYMDKNVGTARYWINNFAENRPEVLKNIVELYPNNDLVVQEIIELTKGKKNYENAKANINVSNQAKERVKENIRNLMNDKNS